MIDSNSRPRGPFRHLADGIVFAILAGLVVALYLMLPRQGDIWWMDASRHALNGAFVLDFLRAMPLRHPIEFAKDYYRQWPALTIGYYPPLFSVVLAAAYAIFGISEAAALVPELAFLLMLGWGAYRLSRNWLDTAPALALAVILIGAPELLYWARQIMLDVPAYAFLIWAAVFHVRYLKGGSERTLHLSVLFAVLAVYTKYNAIFFLAPMALSLLHAKGIRFALTRPALLAGVAGLLLLLPLLGVFFTLSAFNLEQASYVSNEVAGRWTFAGLTYYARIMGHVISWPILALALIYALASPFAPRLRLSRVDGVFLLSWLILGYLFYAMIAVKEPRHILFITYPIALAAVLLLDRMTQGRSFRPIAPLALAAAVIGLSLAYRPAPYVTGMRRAAEEVARLAPAETNVAFWGRFDGTFIYALRAYGARDDLGVVRLDKVLLSDVAVALERGFTQKSLSAPQIVEILANLHVQYVVMQPGYRDDIAVIHALAEALASDKFKEVARVPMSANYPFSFVNELVIYRAVADVPRGRVAPPIQVKVLDKTF